MTLTERFAVSLADLPEARLVVGLSGGLDSTVLLHALASLPAVRGRGLRALHVDHGLHPDSVDWAEHCRRFCTALGVAVNIATVVVTPDGEGPEAAARRARWLAFEQHLDADTDMLVLAHHRDDQAETVLLRLLRGAGPAGLSAMRSFSRRDSGLRVWRPLLDIGRAQLSAYANDRNLSWLDDPGNETTRFDRNHLRHAILPALRARWPDLAATLAQVAARQADACALERSVGETLLAQAMTVDDHMLRLPPLRMAARPARWAALRLWLDRQGVADIGAARLQRIDDELIGAAEDSDPRIELGSCVLRRHRDALHALAPGTDTPLEYRLDWDGRSPLALPGGIGMLQIEPAPREPLPLVAMNRQGGERLRLHANGPRRELKHLLQEVGVPPWLRARWPAIHLDDEVVAFADVVVGHVLQERLVANGSRLRFDPH